uniref:Uncharacterized protein n=1 Tax=Oryza rufipogon TaxID=4529 RepID=A0A0E0NCG8_ORYRU
MPRCHTILESQTRCIHFKGSTKRQKTRVRPRDEDAKKMKSEQGNPGFKIRPPKRPQAEGSFVDTAARQRRRRLRRRRRRNRERCAYVSTAVDPQNKKN